MKNSTIDFSPQFPGYGIFNMYNSDTLYTKENLNEITPNSLTWQTIDFTFIINYFGLNMINVSVKIAHEVPHSLAVKRVWIIVSERNSTPLSTIIYKYQAWVFNTVSVAKLKLCNMLQAINDPIDRSCNSYQYLGTKQDLILRICYMIVASCWNFWSFTI